jgi:2-polyprenyl-6-methoxyphenol hydroxylase-like FAD-dependent oxidoreductase
LYLDAHKHRPRAYAIILGASILTSTSAPDVLAVGAGPTGLTLAANVQAQGASVRIIDCNMDRTRESRALAVQPRTLELLDSLGIAEDLVARGRTSVRLRIRVGRRTVALPFGDVGVEDTAYPSLLFVSQAETEAVLADHLLAGDVHVERGVELVSFQVDEDAVACVVSHGDGGQEQVRCRYLVGCDGAHSTVRHLAGIPFQGDAYPQTFFLGDLEADGDLEAGAINAFVASDAVAFFFPLGRPATWRLIAMRPAQAKGVTSAGATTEAAAASLADLQSITDVSTSGCVRLRDPVWTTVFRLHHRQAAHYRAGRVFLAGDAAHIHSPAGAQGMNTGMQDAWNLAWKLALVVRGVAEDRLLDSYEAERLPVGRFLLRFTDRAFSVVGSGGRLVPVLGNLVVPGLAPLVLRSRRVRAFGFRFVSQLGIRYRRSPVVREGNPAPRRGPRAGDRLPDARIERDGRSTWLLHAIAGPGFRLLLCGRPEAWEPGVLRRLGERYAGLVTIHRVASEPRPDTLGDATGEAFSRLGVRRAAQYLVRPDGHVAFRSAGTDLTGLESYLAQWLPGAPAAES